MGSVEEKTVPVRIHWRYSEGARIAALAEGKQLEEEFSVTSGYLPLRDVQRLKARLASSGDHVTLIVLDGFDREPTFEEALWHVKVARGMRLSRKQERMLVVLAVVVVVLAALDLARSILQHFGK